MERRWLLIVHTVRRCFSALAVKKDFAADDVNRVVVALFTVSLFLPFGFGVASVSLIAFYTMVRCRVREKAFGQPFARVIFGFLAAAFFVAAIYNNYKGMAYALLFYAVVTCGLYFRSVMTHSLFYLAMDTACAASVWCAAAAFFQKAAHFVASPNYRPVSFFTNANYYGMMIEFVILIAVYRIFTNPKYAALYACVIAANLGGLYLTASCSAFAATICSVAVFLAYKRGKRAALLFGVAVGALMALCIAFPVLLPRSSLALETTLAQRISIWQAAWRAFRRSPFFGRGASAYEMVWEQYGGYKTYHCHNLWLDLLLNYGIVGTTAVCCYVAFQLRALVLRIRFGICRNMDFLAAAAFIAVLVHGLTDVTIMWVQTAGLFILMTSSMGIGSVFAEEELHMPHLLPNEADASGRAALAK